MRRGRNVLAVEIHQSSAGSSDISFDMALFGTGQLPPVVDITQPATDLVLPVPQDLSVEANAFDSYGRVVKVGFLKNNVLVSEDFSAPFTAVVSNAAPGSFEITALATDNDGATTRSGAVRITVNAPPSISLLSVGNLVTLGWPASATGFVIQSATNLTPPIVWAPVTNQTQQVGGELTVIVDTSTGQRYFRLSSP